MASEKLIFVENGGQDLLLVRAKSYFLLPLIPFRYCSLSKSNSTIKFLEMDNNESTFDETLIASYILARIIFVEFVLVDSSIFYFYTQSTLVIFKDKNTYQVCYA